MASARTTRRRPLALNLTGFGTIQPRHQPRPYGFSVHLSRVEYEMLLDFVAGVRRWSNKRVTQQSVIRSALSEYLRRHRAWIDIRPDQKAAD